MTRLEQRGAIAFARRHHHRASSRSVGMALTNDLEAPAGVLNQSKLSRLLAHLGLVPAEKARRLRERVPVVEGTRQVADIHLGPGLA
jgi:hypothetical protein